MLGIETFSSLPLYGTGSINYLNVSYGWLQVLKHLSYESACCEQSNPQSVGFSEIERPCSDFGGPDKDLNISWGTQDLPPGNVHVADICRHVATLPTDLLSLRKLKNPEKNAVVQ